MFSDDVQFAELAGFDPTSKSFKLSFAMRPNTLAVLKALWRHGTISDRSGFAVGHLAERVRALDRLDFNVNAVLTTPLMQVAVERVTRGRRTMQIALVGLPRTWLQRVEGALAEVPIADMSPRADVGRAAEMVDVLQGRADTTLVTADTICADNGADTRRAF